MSNTTRRSADSKGVISYLDVLDQEKSKYLLLVDINPVQLLIFNVDKITSDDKTVTGLRLREDAYELVTQFSALYPWYIVNTDLIDVEMYSDSLKRRKKDEEALDALRKEIDPTEDAGAIGPDGIVRRRAVGQYL